MKSKFTWRKLLWPTVWLVSVCLATILAAWWINDQPAPGPNNKDDRPAVEVVEPKGDGDAPNAPSGFAMGWVPDRAASDTFAETLNFPTFADTPAAQRFSDELPTEVFLWDAYKAVTGSLPPCKNQNPIGSCVSFGTNNAIVRTLCASIANKKASFEYKDIAEEVTYAGSRVQIGGGRIGRGDGSVGAWAAQFVQKYGIVSREVHGSFDLTKYDPNRCRSWGSSGVPAELQEIAKKNPVKEVTRVDSWSDAKKALANTYAIAICSNRGFTMQRDANGVARPSGSWGHCMCLDGYTTQGGKEYGHIENSWGASAHTGPVGWGNPTTAGFWAEATVIDGMLRQGDSWAFSDVVGFPARKIRWIVEGPKRPSYLTARELFNDAFSPHVNRRDRDIVYAMAP